MLEEEKGDPCHHVVKEMGPFFLLSIFWLIMTGLQTNDVWTLNWWRWIVKVGREGEKRRKGPD